MTKHTKFALVLMVVAATTALFSSAALAFGRTMPPELGTPITTTSTSLKK